MSTITFLEAVIDTLISLGQFNQNDQVIPVVILWPDAERQWESMVPLLRERLPLLTFDHTQYRPSERRGPAYWLRCMLARVLPDDCLADEVIPIIYLPGVSKTDLRAIEECPKPLQPLAELQHRGVLWTQRNGRDWTIASYLQNKEGGLSIAVGADNATKEAMLQALPKLALEPLARLRQVAPLKSPFFNELLNPDAVRRLLLWLDRPTEYPKHLSQAEWSSFCSLCQQKYGFHPEKDGVITAAQFLGAQKGQWPIVWERFLESPEAYPHIPDLLTQARPVQLSLFSEPSPYWPQDNQTRENLLRDQLTQLQEQVAATARVVIQKLEVEHGSRRAWVWAQLGQAPLALAMEHLTILAQVTDKTMSGNTVAELAQEYMTWGWKADSAVLAALATVTKADDIEAVKGAILPFYRPWLDAAASAMQKVIAQEPMRENTEAKLVAAANGTCVLFSDALRFDVAQRLTGLINHAGFTTAIDWQLAAFPTVTSTAKPAVSPVAGQLSGNQPGLTPTINQSGSLSNAIALRKLLQEAGWQPLQGDNLGDVKGRAWTEMGAIDQYGHQHGWKIAHHIDDELKALAERVEALLSFGWQTVIIVTDHGWLFLPNGLPKIELPQHLTTIRKGRCAVLKEGVNTDQQIIPWHWNQDVLIATAPGIGCYEAGKEYEHGGLSPQECIVPFITVTASKGGLERVEISAVKWRGLRCFITLHGSTTNIFVDILTKAGDAITSLAAIAKAPNADGTVSLVIPDEDREGEAALIVVLSEKGMVRAQKPTIIGEA